MPSVFDSGSRNHVDHRRRECQSTNAGSRECFCGGETVTVTTKKVPTTAIDHVRKAIQMAPDCTTKEVTKVQAVQALISDIQQMQSKGYDWRAIASLLSEHGID